MDLPSVFALVTALSGGPDTQLVIPPGASPDIVPTACIRPIPADEIEGKTLFCGQLQVPEDHNSDNGKTITLNFAVLKARSLYPEPDPLVYLQGGPGFSSLVQIPLYADAFNDWRARRDVVIYDQRSAGASGLPEVCDTVLSQNAASFATLGEAGGADDTSSAIADCKAEIEAKGLDLTHYNSLQNSLDLPIVVKTLGYDQYNIYGVSYGSRLALETMRNAPQNIRSVIIDGVAPSWVPMYNQMGLKYSNLIETLVKQCADDPVCDKAYPDLGRVTTEVANKAQAGELMYRGAPMSLDTALSPINLRNDQRKMPSMTPYIPAYIYELYRGKETPTVDFLIDHGFKVPPLGEGDVVAAAANMTPEQQELVARLLDNAAIVARADQSTASIVADLRDQTESTNIFGAMAELLDREIEKAMRAKIAGNPDLVKPLLADYVGLQFQPHSRDTLSAFVAKNFDGAAKDRLDGVIAAMTEEEVASSFAIVKRDSFKSQTGFLFGLYLDVYACQEDVPYNSLDGYNEQTAKLPYPQIAELIDPLMAPLFKACEVFTPDPREHFHEPVKSDIPTLSIGGMFDAQTPWTWAQIATEGMTNAQVAIVPEVGHGALSYQHCVIDMGVAFIDNPSRKVDDACQRSLQVKWHIADWVGKDG